MFSQVVIKVLGLVYRVVIVDVEGFGNTGNGYYSTGYQIYMILLALSSMGIPNVVSKLVSERVAKKDFIAAHRVFRFCLAIFASLGVDGVIVADFDSIKSLSPESFVNEVLIDALGAELAISGYNFRFGNGASADSKDLVELMEKREKSAIILSEQKSDGKRYFVDY